MTALEIDDGETPETETQRPLKVISLIIRPSVDHGPGHLLQVLSLNRSLGCKIVLSANPAHRLA
jgi:hypothetical protein